MALDGERIEAVTIMVICKPKEGVRSSEWQNKKGRGINPGPSYRLPSNTL